jgi:hypothetical protein
LAAIRLINANQKTKYKYDVGFSKMSNDFVISGIEFEKSFQDIAAKIMNEMKENGNLTIGLANMIQGQVDTSENPRLYLLKQNI